MNFMWKDIMAGLMMGMVLPGLILNFAAAQLRMGREQEVQPAVAITVPLYEEVSEPSEPSVKILKIRLRNQNGEMEEWAVDDYLIGVVLAEMPAWFEAEALKAQAVVARTYALKAYSTGGKHGDGSVCTQPGCCQAYISEDAYLQEKGSTADLEKIRAAVEETSGYVLVYDGDLIEATYFSCSGGKTEDALAVWGTDYPYLRSVNSPGEEAATHYSDTEFFDAEEFCASLGIPLQGSPKDWVESITYTSGGGIAEARICGKLFSGVQLRNLLGLRSTSISITAAEEGITVMTKGYGHRVGMSQYGADAMAVSGSTWQQILSHYYSGTSVVKWKEEYT